MTPDFGGFMDAIFGITMLSIVASLAVPVIIIGLLIWAIRRNRSLQHDPAEEQLRIRLARGEIDMTEFEVRLRALRDGDRS